MEERRLYSHDVSISTPDSGKAVVYGMERCTMMCGSVSRRTWIVMCGARADDVERDGTVSVSVNGGVGSQRGMRHKEELAASVLEKTNDTQF